MPTDARHALARGACAALTLGALAWALVIWRTGGFVVALGPAIVSSRNPLNPLLLAIGFGALTAGLSPPGTRWHAWADLDTMRPIVPATIRTWWGRSRRAAGQAARAWPTGAPGGASMAAAALACAVVWAGLALGALVAGGSDSYGYVSQAHLWARGDLREQAPLVHELDGVVPALALAPAGYGIGPDGTTLAPIYPPGLPMTMAAAILVGGREAPFVVMPVLAGLTVWLTFVLGRRIAGPGAGLVAALFLACSPAFLHQLLWAPMSDVPAAAWWTAALVLLMYRSPGAALAAGLATAAAILTRPNLVFVASVPAAVLIADVVRRRPGDPAMLRLLLFGLGAAPAAIVLTWVHTLWYGSPFRTGYGSLDSYFQWSHLAGTLARYPRWIVETQTPVVALAAAAPWLVRRMRPAADRPSWLVPACLAVAAIVAACYAWYTPFEGWWSLRFLLPAFPPILALTAAAIVAAVGMLPRGTRALAMAAIVSAVACHGLLAAYERGSLDPTIERRYPVVGAWVARELPPRAVIVALQHSGSLRYYANRPTIRWDMLPPGALDDTVAALRRLGYRPYVVVDDWEEPLIRSSHGASRFGALDWEPLVVPGPGSVRVYDLAGR